MPRAAVMRSGRAICPSRTFSAWLAALAAATLAVPSESAEIDRGVGSSESRITRQDPHYERGAHLLRMGDVDAAVASLARAVEIAPDDEKPLALYAQALLVSGDAAAAARALGRLRELDPGSPGLDYFLGLASYQGANWTAARDHLRIALEDNPDVALTQLFLAVAHHELGELDEARLALDDALRLDPSLDGQIAYRRGLLDFEQRRFAAAKMQFESVQARLPGSPLARSATSYISRLARLRQRPWDVHAALGGSYDSNLNLSNDSDATLSSELDDVRLVAEVGSSYFLGDDRRSLTVGQTLYGHFYADQSLFDQQISRSWALAVARLSETVDVDARYTFEFVWTDWAQFRRTHAAEPGVTYTIIPGLRARAFFRWEGREFFFGLTTPGFDRNGDVTRGGADLIWAMPSRWLWGSSWVRLGYRVRRENALGGEFDATGHEPVVTVSLSLPESLSLTVDGRIEWREYDHASSFNFSAELPPGEIRDDVIGQLRAILARPLGNHLSAEIAYSYTNRGSNVDAFDYSRHELSLLTTYHY